LIDEDKTTISDVLGKSSSSPGNVTDFGLPPRNKFVKRRPRASLIRRALLEKSLFLRIQEKPTYGYPWAYDMKFRAR
jgi:hypothetical protein